MTYRLIAIVAATFTVIGIHAAEPSDILEGYGKTKWGQSYEEVAAVLPELVNFEKDEDSGNATYEAAGAEGSVVASVKYLFHADCLYLVIATFALPGGPDAGRDEDALAFIKKQIKEKYEPIGKQLKEGGMTIRPSSGPLDTGTVEVWYMSQSALDKGNEVMAKKIADTKAAKEKARAENTRFDKIGGKVKNEL